MPKKIEIAGLIEAVIAMLPFIVVVLGFKKIHGLIKGSGNQDNYTSKVEVKKSDVEIRENKIPSEGDDNDI